MPEIEIAPEQLARAQVDDLVKNNPERVAQILSNWVVEDRNAVNS
jgi:flagellar biosynthesis/type III secretory pathway M-ring protein FliF/YscJ